MKWQLLLTLAYATATFGCKVTKNCWDGGCTVQVKESSTGDKATVTVATGGFLAGGNDVWNANISDHSGTKYTIDIKHTEWGFNVRGTTEYMVSCDDSDIKVIDKAGEVRPCSAAEVSSSSQCPSKNYEYYCPESGLCARTETQLEFLFNCNDVCIVADTGGIITVPESTHDCIIDDKYWNVEKPECTVGVETLYAGTKAVTFTGKPCINWKDAPDKAFSSFPKNYCRTADKLANGPWCYTGTKSNEWNFCFEITGCFDSQQNCWQDSKPGCLASYINAYVGSKSTTAWSEECLPWDKTSYKYLPSNHCRITNNSPNGPWCYTSSGATRCFPLCSEIGCLSNEEWDINNPACTESSATSYVGDKAVTINGESCIEWSNAKNKNYNSLPGGTCRVTTYSQAGPWCYVEPDRWDYCFLLKGCFDYKGTCWNSMNPICRKGFRNAYSGTRSKTARGINCLPWPVSEDKQRKFDNSENHCRVTDDSESPVCPIPHEFGGFAECFEKCQPKRLSDSQEIIVKVLTLNTWHNGNSVFDGAQKVVNQIERSGADIVFLQEMNDCSLLTKLTEQSKDVWNVVNNFALGSCSNVIILSKYPVEEHYTSEKLYPSHPRTTVGCRVRIAYDPPRVLNLWNNHLDYNNYGPYEACKKADLTDVYKTEYYTPASDGKSSPDGRILTIYQLLSYTPFVDNLMAAQGTTGFTPMIFGGDFNSPSHLDWTETTKTNHCDTAYEWPVSKALETVGFIDSYRKVHPDPLKDPGNTWSPVNVNDIQDRIDFIYYIGMNIETISSETTTGNGTVQPFDKHGNNDWPSDHKGVISVFRIS